MLLQKLTVTAATLLAAGLIAWGASAALVGLSQEPSQELVATPITGADQPPARKATEAEPGVANAAPDKDATKPASSHRLSLRVLSAKTGEPLDGVSVSWELRGEGEPREETVTTGKEGTASIEWPPGITIRFLGLNVKKPGYVGLFLVLGRPQSCHLVAGVAGSAARTGRANPWRGAGRGREADCAGQCDRDGPATEGEEPHYVYELGTTKTDEQGRWQHRRCAGKRLGREPARPPSGLPTASRRNRAAGESGGRSSRKVPR